MLAFLKRAGAIGGWIAALILAAIMFFQTYLAEHPFPAEEPADSTAVVDTLR
jgi:hypothetical protein